MSAPVDVTGPSDPSAAAGPAAGPRSVVGALVAIPVVGAVLGAVGGWWWWHWWSPAPTGRIYDTQAGRTWYPDPFDPGVARDFSGTAEYVVIGLALGALLGIVGGWLTRRRPVAGLAAVVLGAAVAAGVATAVGLAQSPPDPQLRADDVKVGTRLPGHLELASATIDLPAIGDVSVTTPWLMWPVAGAGGFLLVMLAIGATERRPAEPSPRGA